MGHKSKFRGAEIDAILESCTFPSFFYDAFIQEAVTKEVIDKVYQYAIEHGRMTMHDVRLGLNLGVSATNELVVTTGLTIVNDKLYQEVYIFFYDGDGIVHNEYYELRYPLALED